ncbi:helix-turn-helix domain-containing protein [Alteriqipengyuania lutimaris]|uniref:helix-turn-helix domain-containing protein n=1 Tax=Alteriqipengyuania lutimaris TaxID=1538146 RepID=UPI001CFEC938|nr:helix-turn-helix transcriptional regulator [Alteriqipengyuania lutimaris]
MDQIEAQRGGRSTEMVCDLTARQKEILLLVYNRYASKEIAKKLGISPKTVDAHLDAARKLLRCSTRIEAARTYWETLPTASLPIADPLISEASARTAQGERQADDGSLYQHPQSHWPTPFRRTFWPEPSSLGAGTRIALVIFGALGILLVLGGSVGVMSGIYALLSAMLGEPGPR